MLACHPPETETEKAGKGPIEGRLIPVHVQDSVKGHAFLLRAGQLFSPQAIFNGLYHFFFRGQQVIALQLERG